MSADTIVTPATDVSPDIRTPDFRALLGKFRLFKAGEGRHWTFVRDTTNLRVDASMPTNLQQVCPLVRIFLLIF